MDLILLLILKLLEKPLSKLSRSLYDKTVGKLTGETEAKKADKLYQNLKKRYEEQKASIEREKNDNNKKIASIIKSINNSKLIIKTDLFPLLAQKMKILKNIEVSPVFFEEVFSGFDLNIEPLRSEVDLRFDDFEETLGKFKNILSGGFFSRKKAAEKLNKVKEEEKLVEEEIERIKSELCKIKLIEEVLDMIAVFFISLIKIYRHLLNRVDNAVNYLMIKSICSNGRLVEEQMSLRSLPKSQIDEIMAIISISKNLKEMVNKNIYKDAKNITVEDVKSVKEDIRNQVKQIELESI